MKRRLFEDLVVCAPDRPRPRGRAWPVSIVVHAFVLSIVMALIPPARSEPKAEGPRDPLVIEVGKPPAPSQAGTSPRQARAPTARVLFPTPALTVPVQPVAVPVATSVLEGPPGGGTCTSDCGDGPVGPPGPSPGGDGGGTGQPVPISEVSRPNKVRHVSPLYPDLAKRTGAEGVVLIECTIDTEGRVVDTHVLQGHPLLRTAALEAAQQWRYTPTRLNGIPVSVIMTVTVHFRLVR